MKVLVKLTDKIDVQCESETEEGLFRQIAEAQANDSCLGDSKCGACGGTNIQYVVRNNDGVDYFEQHCKNEKCRARLAFGHPKQDKTKLYPKRCKVETTGGKKGQAVRGPDGKAVLLENSGWTKWTPKES